MTFNDLRVSVTPRLSGVRNVSRIVEAFGDANGLAEPQVYAVNLALDELIANAVAHGFAKVRYGARELSGEERRRLQERWDALRKALIAALVRRIDPRRWGRS